MASDARERALIRLGHLKSDRATWWYTYEEITMYLLPRHGRYYRQDHNKGWRRTQAIFDNTATKSLRILGAGLMGGLTSPARPWFRLTTTDTELSDSHDVKEWMAEVTRRILDVLQKSNTYRALHLMYEDLGAFGTTATVMLPDYKDVIRQYPITAGRYCIGADWRGEVDTLYREFEATVGAIVGEFGMANVSSTVKSLYDNNALDQWVPLLHVVEPRTERDPRKKDARNMPWNSTYWELGGRPGQALRVSGFNHFPVLAPRWAVTGGDIYGNGPGMEALGDIKQLQIDQLRKSQGIDYQTAPPLAVPASMKNRDIDRLPGGITFYDGQVNSSPIKTMFDVQLNLNDLLADIHDIRERINGSFYADLFLMIQQRDDPRMTATEVAELHEEKMLMLGPVLERLHNELLEPLITNTFTQLATAGLLPPPPPELQGQDLNVELISVLAQAQRAVSTNGIDRFVVHMGQIAQFKPDIVDNFNEDEWTDLYSDLLGVDPRIIVPSKEVAFIRKQKAAQAQQAQQAAQAQQASTTAKNLAQSPTAPGSNALNDILNMYSGYTQQ